MKVKKYRVPGTHRKYEEGAILYIRSLDTYIMVTKRGPKPISKVKVIRMVLDQEFPTPPKKRT
jgi:hypothetical protein